MKKTSLLTICLSLSLLTSAVGSAQATSGIKNNWKTRYTTACASLRTKADQCLLCHTETSNTADIGNLNAYGVLLMDNNRNFAAAESVDSDTDGRTNGEEILQDCTLPGDLASPTEAFAWGALKSIYR